MAAERQHEGRLPSAALFDLDGTLVDSLRDIAESMNEVLARRGHGEHSLDAYREFIGDGVALLARRALPPDARDDRTVEDCVSEMRRIYGGRWDRHSRPFPGISQALARLSGEGVAIAVLSNKPHDLTVPLVAALFPDTTFAAVVGARTGVPRKPDPTSALAIAREIGVAPADTAYIGDTATDMQTAAAAKMVAVGVAWGFRDREELEQAGAQSIAASPDVLFDCLLGLRATRPSLSDGSSGKRGQSR